MSKHTPGPWLTAGEDKAFVYALSPNGINSFWAHVQTAGQDRISDTEKNANARLIAASPMMYEYIAGRAEAGDKEAAIILESIHAGR